MSKTLFNLTRKDKGAGPGGSCSFYLKGCSTKCHVTNHTEDFHLYVKEAKSYFKGGRKDPFYQPGAKYHFVTMEGPFLDHMNKQYRESAIDFPYKAGQHALLNQDEYNTRVGLNGANGELPDKDENRDHATNAKEVGHSRLSLNSHNSGGNQDRTSPSKGQHKHPHSSQPHGKSQERRKKPKTTFLGKILGRK